MYSFQKARSAMSARLNFQFFSGSSIRAKKRLRRRGKGPRLIELVSQHPEVAPLRLPPVWNEDGAFRAWFDSLQQLPLPEARGAAVPVTSHRT